MHRSDFEGPPFRRSLLSIVGGIVTAMALITGLEMLARRPQSAAFKALTSPAETTKLIAPAP